MLSRLHPFFAVVGAALCLSACGGGSSSSAPVVFPTAPPAAVPAPARTRRGRQSEQPRVQRPRSGRPDLHRELFDGERTAADDRPVRLSPVASISTTSTTLPATYTVTPQGNGVCTFVFTIGNRSATLGINVGGRFGGRSRPPRTR